MPTLPAFFRPACLRVAALAAGLFLLSLAGTAQADEPFYGEVRLFAFNWCPKGWASAQGQTLSLAQNTTLFSLLGIDYGGNGSTTFMLPHLSGRAPVGTGQGPGLSPLSHGEAGGVESAQLTAGQMPMHGHFPQVTSAPASHSAPASGRLLAQASNAGLYVSGSAGADVQWNTSAVGSSTPISVRDPYLVMTWCIAMQGVYPSRN